MSTIGASPSDLLEAGHFLGWYPGQRDLLLESLQFYYSPSQFLGVSLPTGGGKSLVALLLAKMTGARTVILTATKGLMRQYILDCQVLGGVEVKGRNNFHCLLDPSVTAEEGVCNLGLVCDLRDECPYRLQLEVARRSNLVITNYAYWLAQTNYADGLGSVSLIVADEAHLAFGALESFLTVYIARSDIQPLGVTFPATGPSQWQGWRLWAESTQEAVGNEASRLSAEVRSTRRERGTLPSALVRAARRASALHSKLKLLSGLDEQWVVQWTLNGCRFVPKWVSQHSDDLFHTADVPKVVLMSAILSHRTLDYLGVPKNRDWIEAESAFPPENTPIVHVDTARINYHTGDMDTRVWVSRIDQIIQRRLDRKGIVFTVSYERAKLLMARSRFKDIMITHSTRDVMDAVDMFKSSPPPIVLVSPSVTTGYDFPQQGDLAQYIIIGKCVPCSTKVATYDGLKSVSELSIGDLVYSLNKAGEMELAPVISIFKGFYKGDMIVVKNKSLKMRVTADHQALVIDNHDGSYRLQRADSLTKSMSVRYLSIPRAGSWVGNGRSAVDLHRFVGPDDRIVLDLPRGSAERWYPKALYPFLRYDGNYRNWVFRYGDMTDDGFWEHMLRAGGTFVCKGLHGHIGVPVVYDAVDFMSLIGWYASEGYLLRNYEARSFGIVICQNNEANLVEIMDLCHRLGLHFRVDSQRKVAVVGELLYKAFAHFCGDNGAKGKYIDPELRQYPVDALRSMLVSLIAGDGTTSRYGARRYYTASEKLSQDVAEVAIKTGNSARIIYREDKRMLDVALRHTPKSNLAGVRREHFAGPVWCPTVDGNHNFLAFEDDCFFFTGNCPYPDTSDPVARARHEDDKDWSSYIAMGTLVQSAGRCSRSVEDKAECLIIDDSWLWFWPKYREFAPQWFRDRVLGSRSTVPDPLV